MVLKNFSKIFKIYEILNFHFDRCVCPFIISNNLIIINNYNNLQEFLLIFLIEEGVRGQGQEILSCTTI